MSATSVTPHHDQRLPGPGLALTSKETSFDFRRAAHILIGLIRYDVRRKWHHPEITLLALVRVVFAVGLITSAAFFSDAVERVLLDRLLSNLSEITGRPPFSTLAYTFPTSDAPMSLEAVEKLADHVAGTLSSEVKLPVKHVGIRVGSGTMSLQPKAGSDLYDANQRSLGAFNLVYIQHVADHIGVLAGASLDAGRSEDALEVWMPASEAAEMGVQVGDEFLLSAGVNTTPLPLTVMGIWQARNTSDTFWYSNPERNLSEALLVRRADYVERVEPLLPSRSRQVYWHIILDERKADPDNARDYITGFERGEVIISKFVPETRLSASPLVPLEEFVERETVLTTILLSFNLPSFFFLLYFLILTSAIIARWQRGDTASLVSRGMSPSSILGLTAIDELLLIILGLPLGLALGMILARLMGFTASFLSFVNRPALPINPQGTDWLLVGIALLLSLVARLIPAAQAARQSTVTFDRERARPLRAPFWYRFYLDFVLLGATIYVYRQFSDTGTLALLVQDHPQDLYQDPLLILVPALFVLTAAMLAVRAVRLILRLIDRFASVIPWTTFFLVMRRLSRQSAEYINPLLLIIVALGVGVYTLSMAASLDQWLIDRMYYLVGADISIEPLPPFLGDGVPPPVDGRWIPLPEAFASLPGFSDATRLGDYRARISFPGGNDVRGRFLAIDRLDFPRIAWFRPDFADDPLGGLMNQLAVTPDGILVSERLLEQTHMQVGDVLRVSVAASGGLVLSSPFTVAGTYRYFPTVFEDEQPAIIGNMSFLSNLVGAPLPHDLLLQARLSLDKRAIREQISSLGISVGNVLDARGLIQEEQAGMERVGVFGTLSVGFVAAIVMAAIGLMLYTYASLRDRLFRFAVLRAIGLKRHQVVTQVILEYTFLTAFGAVVGALTGLAASALFVPFFRITGEQGAPLPPLISIVATQHVRYMVIGFVSIVVMLQVPVIAKVLSRHHFTILRGAE